MKHICYLAVGVLITIHIEAQKPISFPSEYIDFTIDEQYFTINGIYTFCNNTQKPINHDILFPFATDVSQIDTISIVDLRNFHPLPFKKLKKEVLFNLSVAPGDSTEVNIFYRQKKTIRNTYILTSTQSWGEPLEKAIYTLTTSKKLMIRTFSLQPDSSSTDSENTIYYWNNFNFSPLVNFEVYLE